MELKAEFLISCREKKNYDLPLPDLFWTQPDSYITAHQQFTPVG